MYIYLYLYICINLYLYIFLIVFKTVLKHYNLSQGKKKKFLTNVKFLYLYLFIGLLKILNFLSFTRMNSRMKIVRRIKYNYGRSSSYTNILYLGLKTIGISSMMISVLPDNGSHVVVSHQIVFIHFNKNNFFFFLFNIRFLIKLIA